MGVAVENRPVVGPALEVEKRTKAPAAALELPDGRIVTGKTSALLGNSSSMLLNALNYYFKVLRWDVLLAARGLHYSRLRAWTSFLSSGYVGLLTPGRVGDLLRIQYLRHDP